MTTTSVEPRRAPAGPVLAWGGLGFALGSAAAFGLSGSLASSLLEIGWSPAAVVAARVGGAFLVLLVPCLLLVRRTGLPTRRQVWRLAAYGVIAVALAQFCYFSAVQYLSVGVALLLEYTAPVMLIGWHWLRTRHRPSAAVFVGAALALIGLVLVLDPGHDLSVNPIGVAYGLGAALCLCAYFVLSEESDGEASVAPLLLTTVGTGLGSVLVVGFGVVGLLPFAVHPGTTSLASRSVPWFVPVGLLVAVSAVFAYLSGIVAVRRLGSPLASFVALSEVIFAVAFAIVLVGQHPSLMQVVGGAFVLAGIAAVQRGQSA